MCILDYVLLNNLDKTEDASERHSGKSGLEWKVIENHGEKAHFSFRVMSKDAAILALKRGQIALWIEGSSETDLRYRFDPSNSEARLTYLLLESAFRKQKSVKRKTEVLPLSTIGIRYVDFLITGLMAISIMNAYLWGIGWNLIELRIKKLLRRMVATPLKKSVFLLSHRLNRMVLSAAEMFLLYVFAYFYFDISIQGSLSALALVFFEWIQRICRNCNFDIIPGGKYAKW